MVGEYVTDKHGRQIDDGRPWLANRRRNNKDWTIDDTQPWLANTHGWQIGETDNRGSQHFSVGDMSRVLLGYIMVEKIG